MADDQFEKTEPATPRRRQKFRDDGKVARSKEVSSVLVILGALLYFWFQGGEIFRQLGLFWTENFRLATEMELDIDRIQTVLEVNIGIYMKLMVPFFIVIAFLTAMGHIVQTGWMMTAKPLVPKLNRVDPIARFKQLFLSSKIFMDLTVSLLKITVLVIVLWLVITSRYEDLPGLVYLTPYGGASEVVEGILDIMFKTALIFIAVAIIDYIFQWFKQEKEMRMSKQELKDEFKESEGDPQLKGHIRTRMREVSMNKMIDSVPKADVVVTNPTHIAVAIRYEAGVDSAPTVVAKGQGFWAERIKTIARDNGVEIVEDKLLARSLHKSVKIGQEIPAQLYRAVAELLAHVYGLKNKMRARRA